MNSRFSSLYLLLTVIWALGAGAALAAPEVNGMLPDNMVALPDDLVTVSTVTSPEVSYSVRKQGENLLLVIEAGSFQSDGKGVSVQVGASADKTLTFTQQAAKITYGPRLSRFTFKVPGTRLVDSADGWKKLHLAFAVEWAGGPNGQARQRERFLHVTPGAAHTGVSQQVMDWLPIDLAEVERLNADRAQHIAIDFDQPLDGKASIVIDDVGGKRIRNLISAQPMTKGRHRIEWDGLDEQGNVSPPGNYRWRALSHPGLSPVHLFDFVDAPGSNHSTFHAAAFNGSSLFFAAPVSEGGFELVEFATDGTYKRGFNPPNGHGLRDVAIVADDAFVYMIHDGRAWGDKIDTTKADWKAFNTVSLLRVDLKNWSVAEFPGKTRYADLAKYEVGPGSSARADVQTLAGAALIAGHLYIGDSINNAVIVVDPATGKVERTFPLTSPVALAGGDNRLYALAAGKLLQIEPATGATTVVATLAGQPVGLTVGADGRFYVSDLQDEVVHVLDSKGALEKTIGHPGGVHPGPYDPLNFHHPRGLAVAAGLLWVTEKGRWTPKRLSAYTIATGVSAHEYFGPTNYGAQGAGFDYADHTHWIGQGTFFDVDFATGKARPISVLGGEEGRRHTFWRQDGRTFVISSGKATYIQELTAAGLLKPLAMISSAHQFSYEHDWRPPQAFLDAFTKAYPSVKITIGKRGGIDRGTPPHGYGMLWVDKNGDGQMQADEIEFSTKAENLAGSGWSHDFHDLTLRVPGVVAGKKVLVTLKPDGWWPGGAPRYPALNEAVVAGVPIDLPGSNQVESAVDRFGNTLINSDPLTSFAPDGRQLWTYVNHWSGVHGSHGAPLPLVGQLQGTLFFSGVVPLDEKSDVFLMNGNHGQAFLLTSDGIYIDAMFPDVRMMTNPQAGGIGILGGECFGGTFGRSEKDGNYYFQGGGIAYRVYRVDGLRDTRRSEGELVVTAGQSAAAERNQTRLVADKIEPRTAVINALAQASVIDGKDVDWKNSPVIKWDRGTGRFPVSVRLAYDATNLYLHYTVRDESPWVNQGKDWQALFKTGDGVDLQLGVDPTANPRRSGPVPGDLRLFVAPSAEGNVAVLYRHRVPGATDGSVVFQSPWRSEKVDVVRKLDSAKIAVLKTANDYRVEVSVPLADLGLKPTVGLKLRGDVGVIYGDGEGTVNVFRNYWSNRATGLVNDVPGEIMLTPSLWGEFTFGGALDAPSPEAVK